MARVLSRLAVMAFIGFALGACSTGDVAKSGKEVQHPMAEFSVPYIPGV